MKTRVPDDRNAYANSTEMNETGRDGNRFIRPRIGLRRIQGTSNIITIVTVLLLRTVPAMIRTILQASDYSPTGFITFLNTPSDRLSENNNPYRRRSLSRPLRSTATTTTIIIRARARVFIRDFDRFFHSCFSRILLVSPVFPDTFDLFARYDNRFAATRERTLVK